MATDTTSPMPSSTTRQASGRLSDQLSNCGELLIRKADGLSKLLEQPNWRATRAHIEEARNAFRQNGLFLQDRAKAVRAANRSPLFDELVKALEEIVRVGSRTEMLRIGDPWHADGWKESACVSFEAKIAGLALSRVRSGEQPMSSLSQVQGALMVEGAEKIRELRRERDFLARLLMEIEAHPDATEDLAHIIRAGLPRHIRQATIEEQQ